jgi:hypothetical protein
MAHQLIKKKIENLDMFMDIPLASSIKRSWQKQTVQYFKAETQQNSNQNLMCIMRGS